MIIVIEESFSGLYDLSDNVMKLITNQQVFINDLKNLSNTHGRIIYNRTVTNSSAVCVSLVAFNKVNQKCYKQTLGVSYMNWRENGKNKSAFLIVSPGIPLLT